MVSLAATPIRADMQVRPRALQLETSSACQLRCPACPTTSGSALAVVGTGLLGVDALRGLFDANPALKRIELSNYGEIFLNPALPDILRLCDERGVAASAANGVNLNSVRADAIEAVVRHRLRVMTVSIDGATQETYARYRVGGRLDSVLANIVRINVAKRRLKAALPVLRWQFIVFPHNAHELEAARALACELDMVFAPRLSWDHGDGGDGGGGALPDDAALRDMMPGGALSRREFHERTGEDYAGGICNQLWDSPQVNWDGKMLGCCRNVWGDFGANVFQDGFVAAVNSERMTLARAMLTGRAAPRADIPCATCDLYQGMQSSGRYMRRDGTASGQIVDRDEALGLARLWLQAGRVAEARGLCRAILQAEPANTAALGLLFEMERASRLIASAI